MSEREMPAPGPARDALIAELVMGWTADDKSRRRNYGTCAGWYDSEGAHRCRLRSWSTDDHAALDVLKEMKREWWAEIHMGARFGIGFTRPHKSLVLGGETSPSFADAVTQAAIRAKRAEQEAAR